MSEDYLSIGEVAQAIGLSLRTIRYYEELGIVVPTGRTKGGHRLYSAANVDQLRLIMKMKPLDFSLDEMRGLLRAWDLVAAADTPESDRVQALSRLAMFGDLVEQRWLRLQEQLGIAEAFRAQLRGVLATHDR